MELKGSCHCGGVKFTVQSPHPYPFNPCYCSICRKTAGGGGYAINLSGRYKTPKIAGRKNITVHRARMHDEATGKVTKSTGRRHFCKKCGGALRLRDPQWPELVHPFASAIDTDLPVPPERTHLAPSARGERSFGKGRSSRNEPSFHERYCRRFRRGCHRPRRMLFRRWQPARLNEHCPLWQPGVLPSKELRLGRESPCASGSGGYAGIEGELGAGAFRSARPEV